MARVKVFNQSLLQGLMAENPSVAGSPAQRPPSPELEPLSDAQRVRQQQKHHLKDLEELRQRRYERNRRDAQVKAAESDRKIREQVTLSGLRRENSYRENFSSIMDGRALSAAIKVKQDLQDQADHTKKVKQFDDWNSQVYGKIVGRVAEQLEQLPSDLLTRRRNVEFQKFLDVTNSKGAIFRDIIIESEYDPLEPNRCCIKVQGNDLFDPTSRVLDKALDEKGIMASRKAMRAARVPHTREVLDVLDWGTGRIEDTPHGFFARMMSKVPPTGEVSGTFKSVIPFDHYNVAMGKAAVDVEFPKGKRIRPKLDC